LKVFNHVKLPELAFDLVAKTTDTGRRYFTPEGNAYPSVTTILSDSTDKSFLIEWRKRIGEAEANKITKKSSTRGTKLHSICEKYLLNEMNEMKIRTLMPDIKDFFLQLKPHIDENVDNVYGTEQALYCDVLKIAGRTDCIAEWNGKLSIIDYKNSIRLKEEKNIQNYFLQCSAYAQMFEYLTKIPIEQIVVAIANEEGEPQIFIKETSLYVDTLKQLIQKYHSK
jgi:genome maintenance exonuclease 1